MVHGESLVLSQDGMGLTDTSYGEMVIQQEGVSCFLATLVMNLK